jgi:FtsH-binding integral membrane protein
MDEQTIAHGGPGAPVPVVSEDRGLFLARTYGHLLGAVLAFVVLEVFYFSTSLAVSIAEPLLSVDWLLVLGVFIVVSWGARGLAARSDSLGAQYLGLGVYVVAESIIFVPLLYVAESYAPGAIRSAGSLTVLAFVGLTAIVIQSGKDFSFLAGLLRWAAVVAIVAIVGALLFGFGLGTWFSVAMVGLAGAAILYDTSKILYHYPSDRYVAAALELFASVALMFWYLVRIFTSRR